ncbi:hypothetical protein [Solibacillus isronensis]|uniref:hypothetical protein n=1 Tax=Solibacillus isronensis TaxID=412383 RepID=UPI0009A5E437
MLQDILSFLKKFGVAKNVYAISDKQGCADLMISRKSDVKAIYEKLYSYGDIKLNRKYEILFSLMI